MFRRNDQTRHETEDGKQWGTIRLWILELGTKEIKAWNYLGIIFLYYSSRLFVMEFPTSDDQWKRLTFPFPFVHHQSHDLKESCMWREEAWCVRCEERGRRDEPSTSRHIMPFPSIPPLFSFHSSRSPPPRPCTRFLPTTVTLSPPVLYHGQERSQICAKVFSQTCENKHDPMGPMGPMGYVSLPWWPYRENHRTLSCGFCRNVTQSTGRYPLRKRRNKRLDALEREILGKCVWPRAVTNLEVVLMWQCQFGYVQEFSDMHLILYARIKEFV